MLLKRKNIALEICLIEINASSRAGTALLAKTNEAIAFYPYRAAIVMSRNSKSLEIQTCSIYNKKNPVEL